MNFSIQFSGIFNQSIVYFLPHSVKKNTLHDTKSKTNT